MESNYTSNYGTARFRKYYASVKKWGGSINVQKSLILGLSFFLVAFFIAFALRPTLTKISELRVEISESEETLEKLQKKSQDLVRVATIWDEASPYIPALRASLPIEPEYRTFLKELEVLIRRHNITFLNASYKDSLINSQIIDPYDITGTLSAVPIGVSFRVNGEWENIKALLSDMVNFDRVIDIESITITNSTNRNSRDAEIAATGALDVSVVGDFYYFADKSAIYKILGTQEF